MPKPIDHLDHQYHQLLRDFSSDPLVAQFIPSGPIPVDLQEETLQRICQAVGESFLFSPVSAHSPWEEQLIRRFRSNILVDVGSLSILARSSEDANLRRCFPHLLSAIRGGVPRPILRGTATEQAAQIRIWMNTNRHLLAQIEGLYFLNLGLTVLPQEFCDPALFPNLKTLCLSGNQLSVLPPRIGELSQLKVLIARNNKLQGLPATIGRLPLEFLDLTGNRFDSVPTEIRPLKETLKDLILSKNQLTALPSWVGEFTNLELFRLDSNAFRTFPRGIFQLRKLYCLALERNPFTLTSRDYERLRDQIQQNPIPDEMRPRFPNLASRLLLSRTQLDDFSWQIHSSLFRWYLPEAP